MCLHLVAIWREWGSERPEEDIELLRRLVQFDFVDHLALPDEHLRSLWVAVVSLLTHLDLYFLTNAALR